MKNIKNQEWIAYAFCLLPVSIYLTVFCLIAENVNYLAFDDILILGVIPQTINVSPPELWHRLTELFPEHRLVFSRSIVLVLNGVFGKINLVWLMVIGNICWAGCAVIFYKVFRKLRISIWYFVPVMWIWFNIQSFENIFWGVSSLCNFGVLLFVIASIYVAVFCPEHLAITLGLVVVGTFTYGNGLLAFPVIAIVYLINGRRTHFILTLTAALVTAIIYFQDFKPITSNLDFRNPVEVKEGILGVFGFVGSIATVSAYSIVRSKMLAGVLAGILGSILLLFLFRNEWKKMLSTALLKRRYENGPALFSFAIALFIAITALALVYKRVPSDGFDGVFKGRYRMYSTLLCVSLYISFLSLSSSYKIRKAIPAIMVGAIFINFLILYQNFASAVNNRREAVVQEFNARYNENWLGLRMFNMSRPHYENVRSYYQSADPLAEGWDPRSSNPLITCNSGYIPSEFTEDKKYIRLGFSDRFFPEKADCTDGPYLILKSKNHAYMVSANQLFVPLKTAVRRQIYFAKGAFARLHKEAIDPGEYYMYLLLRKNHKNRIYCTNRIWVKK